jgi:hypothetical protein
MQQENRDEELCKNNGSVMREITFTKLQICTENQFDITAVDNANYELVFNGPAVNGGTPLIVSKQYMNQQNQSVTGDNCLTATWSMLVNTCQPYFEAEFRSWVGNDKDTMYSFVNLNDATKANDGQFMRRTCDLQVSSFETYGFHFY